MMTAKLARMEALNKKSPYAAIWEECLKVEDILSSFDWGEGSHPLIGSARFIGCRYANMRLYCALSKAKAANAVPGNHIILVAELLGHGARGAGSPRLVQRYQLTWRPL